MEEIDWLFHNNVPLRKFGNYQVPDLYEAHANKLELDDAASPGAQTNAAQDVAVQDV
jgi:hypothetical protein